MLGLWNGQPTPTLRGLWRSSRPAAPPATLGEAALALALTETVRVHLGGVFLHLQALQHPHQSTPSSTIPSYPPSPSRPPHTHSDWAAASLMAGLDAVVLSDARLIDGLLEGCVSIDGAGGGPQGSPRPRSASGASSSVGGAGAGAGAAGSLQTLCTHKDGCTLTVQLEWSGAHGIWEGCRGRGRGDVGVVCLPHALPPQG